ncbi:MAG: PDZ domain-containing protein [Planctomycetaceae bacterium]
MKILRKFVSAVALSCGMLGMAVAQQTDSDAAAQAGAENSAADTDTNADSRADSADANRAGSAFSGQSNVDGSLNSQTNDSQSPDNADRSNENQADGRFQDGTAGMTFRSDADGIVVDNVANDSPAARLGLQPGDEIVRFNGQWVSDRQQLQQMMNNVNGSRPIDISFRRDGRQLGRQIMLNDSGQNYSAMRPMYDENNGSGAATGNNNGMMAQNPGPFPGQNAGQFSGQYHGQYSGPPVHQAGFSQPYPVMGNGHYGTSACGCSSQVGYGHSYVNTGCCDNHWDGCCRTGHRRHRARRCRRY